MRFLDFFAPQIDNEHTRRLPLGDFSTHGRIQLPAPSADTPFGPGCGETRRCSFTDHRSFELGEGPDDLHHHSPGRSGGVDVLSDVQHVLQRTRQPVELPDDDSIALAEMVEQTVQLGPIPTPARCGLLEQASATCDATIWVKAGGNQGECPDRTAAFLTERGIRTLRGGNGHA
jgi:hypothetical protein